MISFLIKVDPMKLQGCAGGGEGKGPWDNIGKHQPCSIVVTQLRRLRSAFKKLLAIFAEWSAWLIISPSLYFFKPLKNKSRLFGVANYLSGCFQTRRYGENFTCNLPRCKRVHSSEIRSFFSNGRHSENICQGMSELAFFLIIILNFTAKASRSRVPSYLGIETEFSRAIWPTMGDFGTGLHPLSSSRCLATLLVTSLLMTTSYLPRTATAKLQPKLTPAMPR